MKPLLSGYKAVSGYVVAGVVIPVVLLISYFGYRSFFDKSDTITPTVTAAPTPTPLSYDGTYKGTTGVAGGLADATLTVSGKQFTGKATFKGKIEGFSVSLPVTLNGNVTASGAVSGTVVVSGKVSGQTVSLTGAINGSIIEDIMNCDYNVSGNTGKYGGKISLAKG